MLALQTMFYHVTMVLQDVNNIHAISIIMIKHVVLTSLESDCDGVPCLGFVKQPA